MQCGYVFWVQYHINTSGGAVVVIAVWVCCWRSTMVNSYGGAIAVVLCGYVVLGAVPV